MNSEQKAAIWEKTKEILLDFDHGSQGMDASTRDKTLVSMILKLAQGEGNAIEGAVRIVDVDESDSDTEEDKTGFKI